MQGSQEEQEKSHDQHHPEEEQHEEDEYGRCSPGLYSVECSSQLPLLDFIKLAERESQVQ